MLAAINALYHRTCINISKCWAPTILRNCFVLWRTMLNDHIQALCRGRRHQQRWLFSLTPYHRSATWLVKYSGSAVVYSDVPMWGANPGRIIVLLYEAVCVYICYCVTNKSGLLRSIFVRQSVYARGMRHNKSNVHDIRRTMC